MLKTHLYKSDEKSGLALPSARQQETPSVPENLEKYFKMNFLGFGLLALCVVATAAGQMLLGIPGKAPEFPQMQNYDGSKANGKWYGHYYSNNGIPPLPIHCWSFVATPADEGKVVANVTLYLPLEIKTDFTVHVNPVEGESAKFIMQELTKGPLTTSMVVPYTDYDTIFVKLDIFQLANAYAYSINVYTRTPEDMDKATLEKVKTELRNIGIDDELTFVPQDCPKASLQDVIKSLLM